MVKIGIIGSGDVGVRLANGLASLGYEITLGVRGDKKVEGWDGTVASFNDVAKQNKNLILAVKGTVAEEVIISLKSELDGKIIIDVTNPIARPPENGVLKYFTNLDESLMERLAKIAPKAKFAKAFNSVGNNVMFEPDYNGTKGTTFICGDKDAKDFTTEVLEKIGWEVADMGGNESARVIEPLCTLWCIVGFNGGGWDHSFKLLKKT